MTENKIPIKFIDFGKIYRILQKNSRLYFIVLPIAFLLAVLIMICVPNYYVCTVKLSPELSNRSSSSSSLASLASSFGVKLGNVMGNSSEALFPTLYPDLMESVDFQASLFNVKVRPEDSEQAYRYFIYLKDIKKRPWWSKAAKSIKGFFKEDEPEADIVNPRKLTKEQNEIANNMKNDITCDVDYKTMVITLSVTDNDPLVCTTMADSAMSLLQQYITDYRTRKARVDLEYNKKLLNEAKAKYEKASRAYAAFADANLHTFQERILQRKAELETEMALQRTVYQQVVAQYQQAEMKVQEDTPAFAVIQASTIPAKKSGPSRAINCILIVFVAFLGTTIYILFKENEINTLLGF